MYLVEKRTIKTNGLYFKFYGKEKLIFHLTGRSSTYYIFKSSTYLNVSSTSSTNHRALRRAQSSGKTQNCMDASPTKNES